MRVLGYRAFDTSDGTLDPIGVRMPSWQPGLNVAECVHVRADTFEPHRPGHPQCQCGFWALASLHVAIGRVGLWPPPDRGLHGVGFDSIFRFAAVVGSGQVTLHQHGWRAERAQVVALIKVLPWDVSIDALAARYGVACIDATAAIPDPSVWGSTSLSLFRIESGAASYLTAVDELKVARWVSEFGVRAERGDWPERRLDGDIPRIAVSMGAFAAPAARATPNPVPLPRRKWWQWR